MNFEVKWSNSLRKWHASILDRELRELHNGVIMFSGDGQSIEEAVGSCLIANREVLNATFEIVRNKEVLRSTIYNQPRPIRMPEFVKFPSIESFDHIVRAYQCFCAADAETPLIWPFPGYTGPTPRGTMKYRGKIKLHGTNAGITVHDGLYIAQRREGITTVGDCSKGNYGFAQWVEDHKDYWTTFARVRRHCNAPITIFGEWCGPGVVKGKGTAISMLDHKIFAIFAVQVGERMVVDPTEINIILNIAPLHADTPMPSTMHILPWSCDEFFVDLNDRKMLEGTTKNLNTVMEFLEPTDPWVRDTFDVIGTAEGTVYYPLMEGTCYVEAMRYAFKVKGEKHRVTKTKESVQIDPEVAASIDDFVNMTVTEARLEQGATAVGINIKNIKEFLAWIAADIQKENQDELDASDLEWGQVASKVAAAARAWYVAESKRTV